MADSIGGLGPFPNEYDQPHVYARDVHSGVGACVCGAELGAEVHTEAAPGIDIPATAVRFLGKSAAVEKRYVLGVAYQAGYDPRIAKGADGHRDIFSAAELEKAAWSYMDEGGSQVGVYHLDGTTGRVRPVESYIYRGPDWDLGEVVVKSGDWLIGVICDEAAWELVKSGKLAGFSPQGVAKRRPAPIPPSA